MMKPLFLFYLACSCLALSACSSQPQQVLVSPHLTASSEAQTAKHFTLITHDLRTNRFLFSIHEGDKEQVQLIASRENLRRSMEDQLQQAWLQSGYSLDDASEQSVSIEILELSGKVEQSTVKHVVTATIRLKASIDGPKQSLVKQYRSINTNEGAFSVDIDKQAELMSLQFSQLLQQLVDDPQLLDVLE